MFGIQTSDWAATRQPRYPDSGTLQLQVEVFKGVLIVSAVMYVTITWALQAIARFN